MLRSRISARGQITLPPQVCQALSVKPGDRLLFVIDDQTVSLRPLGAGSARALAGSLKHYAEGRRAESARASVKKEVGRAAAQER